MFFRRILPACVVLIGLFPTGPAETAPDQPEFYPPREVKAVVELFTSQGCSSCPPADALFRTYADMPNIMALSLPVDYWDYIGWRDTFASPRNSERQRAYARAMSNGPVYTPQVVVNGAHVALGSSRSEIDKAIDTAAAEFETYRVPVRFWHEKNTIVVDVGSVDAAAATVKEATIWLGVIQKKGEVTIQRGENGGKTLAYANIVRELVPVGVWSGKPTVLRLARTAVLLPETENSVVLVQEGDFGRIVGAAWLGQ